jgi:hypothetical protein
MIVLGTVIALDTTARDSVLDRTLTAPRFFVCPTAIRYTLAGGRIWKGALAPMVTITD